MADSLEKYLSLADKAGACPQYMEMLRACRSKRQAVDVALRGGAVEFLARMLATEAISIRDFERDFGMFANGAYRASQPGYTSAMWIGADTAEIADACSLVVDCRAISVQPRICEIHIAGQLPVISGPGSARVCYHLPDGSTNRFRYYGL